LKEQRSCVWPCHYYPCDLINLELLTLSAERNQFGRIGGEITGELRGESASGTARFRLGNERYLTSRKPIEKVIFSKCAPFPCRRVLKLPPAVRQSLKYQELTCSGLNPLPLSQRV